MKTSIRLLCGIIAAAAVAFGLLYQPANYQQTRQDTYWLLSLLVAGIFMLGAFWIGRSPFSTKRGMLPEERLQHNVQRLGSVLMVLFLLISLQLLRQMIVISDSLEQPFTATNAQGKPIVVQDPRVLERALTVQRGRIYDAAGGEVAGFSAAKDGLVKRTYNLKSPLLQLIGYFNPVNFGTSGLENSYEEYLNGTNSGTPFVNWQRQLLNQPTQGSDLFLTIDPRLQQVAVEAQAQRSGAIVLLDAKTGAILAMAGFPNYNPAPLAYDPTLRGEEREKHLAEIQRYWTALNNDPKTPLVSRATQGLFAPGSIFKTVTLAGVLDAGKTTPQAQWKDTGSIVVDGATILDNNRPDTSRTNWTTAESYMFSLNAVYVQMGLTLKPDPFIDYGQRFGFGKTMPFDIPVSTSKLFLTPNYLLKQTALAESSFGQGELLLNPLHGALIAAAMGRGDGVIPKPYMVREIKARDGTLVKTTTPNETWLQTVRPETAATVRDIMRASFTDGWVGRALDESGKQFARLGITSGGKTGTAEVVPGFTNAWYLGWATKGDRILAVAAVSDRYPKGEGLYQAMPGANKLLLEALKGS